MPITRTSSSSSLVASASFQNTATCRVNHATAPTSSTLTEEKRQITLLDNFSNKINLPDLLANEYYLINCQGHVKVTQFGVTKPSDDFRVRLEIDRSYSNGAEFISNYDQQEAGYSSANSEVDLDLNCSSTYMIQPLSTNIQTKPILKVIVQTKTGMTFMPDIALDEINVHVQVFKIKNLAINTENNAVIV